MDATATEWATDLTDVGAVMGLAPVIPVATIGRPADAVPLAEALLGK